MPYQLGVLYDETVELTVREVNGEEQTVPNSVSNSGTGSYTGINGKIPIQGYHRVTGTSDSTISGYGDYDITEEVNNMVLVLTNNRAKTKIKANDLARAIKASFPTSLSKTQINTPGIYDISMNILDTNLNKSDVISSEYITLERGIRDNYDLISIAYDIEISIDHSCLTLC